MRKAIPLVAGLGLLAGGQALAAEGGGMPQLNVHDFPTQLVWLAIAFLALYLVMSRIAMPAVADTLAKRQAKIQGDLDAAEQANRQTNELIATYEKRLAESREEARRLMRDQGEADTAAATARFQELHDRLAKQIDEAEQRIARQRDDVMAGLEGMAQDIGRDVYAKLIGQPADQGALAARIATAAQGAGAGGNR
jgi:F-type H+-transporting ATPase subunit b